MNLKNLIFLNGHCLMGENNDIDCIQNFIDIIKREDISKKDHQYPKFICNKERIGVKNGIDLNSPVYFFTYKSIQNAFIRIVEDEKHIVSLEKEIQDLHDKILFQEIPVEILKHLFIDLYQKISDQIVDIESLQMKNNLFEKQIMQLTNNELQKISQNMLIKNQTNKYIKQQWEETSDWKNQNKKQIMMETLKKIALKDQLVNKYKDAFEQTWKQTEEIQAKFLNLYEQNLKNLECIKGANLKLLDCCQKIYEQLDSTRALIRSKLLSEDIKENCLIQAQELILQIIDENKLILKRIDENGSDQEQQNKIPSSSINSENQLKREAYEFCSKCEDQIRSYQNEIESQKQEMQRQFQLENKYLKVELSKLKVNFLII